MSRSFMRILGYPARLWARIYRLLTERNSKAVDDWGAALQYKRRYTNPEDAKSARKAP